MGHTIRDKNYRRLPCLLAAFALPLLALSAGPVFAHADSPGSPPLVPNPLRLKYRKPAEIVALFARERLPPGPGPTTLPPGGTRPTPTAGVGAPPSAPPTLDDHIPRAARSDEVESLVPNGVDAVLRTENPDEVVLVGTEGVPDIRNCIQLLDVPLERTGPDREKVVLTLQRADARRLRASVLRLPEAGSAVLKERQLVLEGKRAWLHRALRQVIRAELKEPDSTGLQSP